ncbi:YheC/YheD family endospore coat-associated protein [Paenibacillus sp. USDA918EY]|uniref:YheC/YheD family endospore coat-associated protein n=1 Tax=Paenibacillus sp. USDA918EY TaxID=2689575 RepID=UPI001357CE54|nr:YheC/YheD family protein [Paenibacillus sp. USDA918EY]
MVLPLGTLGIMCCSREDSPPFSNEGYCRKLSVLGKKYGIQVVVFRPADVSLDRTHIHGFIYKEGAWRQNRLPFPDIVYDRCLYRSRKEFRLAASLLSDSRTARDWTLWSRSLPGKWQVFRMLSKEPDVLPYLPPTGIYRGKETLIKTLESHGGEAFLKPKGGSQGKNTLYVRVDRESGIWAVKGRDSLNRPVERRFPSDALAMRWIGDFTKNRTYIIQPYLHLQGRNGRSFDTRVLMQKNEKGLWMQTGIVVREGAAGSMTSNLHGGGKALPVLPYLSGQFGAERAERLTEVIRRLSEKIPPILESHFGRLGELGIDFGIDTKGNVWLLEVNSKPGRTSIRQAGDPDSAVLASENPLRYARYLLLRQLRRVN